MTTPRHGRAALAATALALAALGVPGSARAQAPPSSPPSPAPRSAPGAIEVAVADEAGAPLVGVTAVASAPSPLPTRECVTGEGGRCRVGDLPAGNYLVVVYFGDRRAVRRGVWVSAGRLVPVGPVVVAAVGGERVVVAGRRGIDPTSAALGNRLGQEELTRVPVPGRTFDTALGSTAGSAGDARGVGFSGSTSLENQYVVDGVNTSSLTYGSVGTPLINEFVQAIEVKTGGYRAEHGRATGAIVDVVTKTGTNDLHGGVFATVIPYQVDRTEVRDRASSIDGTTDLDYSGDVGFDLGGPLARDRAWYYVGLAPRFARSTVTRSVRRQTDCRARTPDGGLTECDPLRYADGSPDEDPATGDRLFEEVDRRRYRTSERTYQFIGKLNGAVTPDHQGQLSVIGAPTSGTSSLGVLGGDDALRIEHDGLTTDVAARWTSRLDDGKTELGVTIGWHRASDRRDPLAAAAGATPRTTVLLSTLGRFAAAGGESAAARRGCADGGDLDPYPRIVNCPLQSYALDSPGSRIDDLEDRRVVALTASHRLAAAGDHELKVGLDVEDDRTRTLNHLTGGRLFQLIPDVAYREARVYRYVRPGEGDDVCGLDAAFLPRACDYLDRSTSRGRTINWAAFAQDTWRPRPDLTIDVGLRYEEQRLRFADAVAGTVDPFTMQPLGDDALVLRGMLAPRLGAAWDPTREGRARAFASYGRFYESIPLALNDFSFSGTTLYGAYFGFDQCDGATPSPDASGASPNPRDCPEAITFEDAPRDDVYRGGTTLVAPGTRAQYMDEIHVGGEAEVLEDLTVGLVLRRRWIGRVLEDMSTDGGETYVIGNPGEFPADEERALEERLAELAADDPERDRLADQLAAFRAIRGFPRARRAYLALEATAIKRLARGLFVQGSYTLSRTRGNYPGLLDADTGDALPNFSTQYDLPELLANRDGRLPQDRTHYLKLDGYYLHDLGGAGQVTYGLRFRALSGTPIDRLGSSDVYGLGESYLLPRGGSGRTPLVTTTDVHLGYDRALAAGVRLGAFVDVFNLWNQEQVASVDELYTTDNANPIVGGDERDLIFGKRLDAGGRETSLPLGRNIAYRTTLSRYAPLFVRIGARLTF